MSSNDASQGMSHCYVFKSRLQEYAQKSGLTTPIYHTIKEGPCHQPFFRSTVVVDNVSYHSWPGFLNRKAAEQSAAEVALVEIAKSGATDKSVSHPVHETGLCKNLLQEYAQKMNYAIPLYTCTKDEKKGKDSLFSCTVELGGIKYIGAAAKTKKEAEVKAAKTALLAIKISGSESDEKPESESEYTVMPAKRKAPDPAVVAAENKVNPNKVTGRFQKRRKKKYELLCALGIKNNDSLDGNEVKDSILGGNEVKDSNSAQDPGVVAPDSKVNARKRRKGRFLKRQKKRFRTPGDVLVDKKDDSFSGEVKDSNSDGNGVKDPNSDGNEVKAPNLDGNEIKDLNSDLVGVKKDDSFPGEVKALNLDRNEAKYSNSGALGAKKDDYFLGEVKTSNLDRNEVKDSNLDILGAKMDDSFPGEVKYSNLDGYGVKDTNLDGNEVKAPNVDGNEGCLSCCESVLDRNVIKELNLDGNEVKAPNLDGNKGRLSCGESALVPCDDSVNKNRGPSSVMEPSEAGIASLS